MLTSLNDSVTMAERLSVRDENAFSEYLSSENVDARLLAETLAKLSEGDDDLLEGNSIRFAQWLGQNATGDILSGVCSQSHDLNIAESARSEIEFWLEHAGFAEEQRDELAALDGDQKSPQVEVQSEPVRSEAQILSHIKKLFSRSQKIKRNAKPSEHFALISRSRISPSEFKNIGQNTRLAASFDLVKTRNQVKQARYTCLVVSDLNEKATPKRKRGSGKHKPLPRPTSRYSS
ncbi:hypothetical protein [Donghicola eburneus]|uniref:Uncharacterized protein n=1 Tax=Donghicola eburneus TaxID=393278 RepID=A0A1M4MWF2_9RHOB|nr:hypothetical protein [Donghicola eburneus]SCM66843.1 hypothetical protein KARMA_1025 [Donghicola eburneus]